ncbi:MAG: MoaD/ThiS family protein [Elusimicrobiota bacterium]
MVLKIIFFAQCADWMGRRRMELALDRPTPLGDLLRERSSLAPLAPRRRSLKVAVNHAWAGFRTTVRAGDVVAFMPPFSGG